MISYCHSSIILNRIRILSFDIFQLISNSNYRLARDLSLQSLSLFDLLLNLNISSSLLNSLEVCYISYEYLTNYLLKVNNSNNYFNLFPINSISSNYSLSSNGTTSSTLTSNLNENKKEVSNQNIQHHDDTMINFSKIIGCEEAKQILYENIVLPLSLPIQIRSSIFQGVRSSGGNVLLFGPPGTGIISFLKVG